MTNLPEMTPSPETRADLILNEREQEIGLGPAVDEGLQRAFRDDALAERERIVVMLREPPADLAADLGEDIASMAIRAAPELAARAILRFIAARIAADGKDGE